MARGRALGQTCPTLPPTASSKGLPCTTPCPEPCYNWPPFARLLQMCVEELPRLFPWQDRDKMIQRWDNTRQIEALLPSTCSGKTRKGGSGDPPFHLFDLESTSDTMILEGDGERARLFLHKGLCLTEPEAFAMCWASITSPYRDGSFCNSTLTL